MWRCQAPTGRAWPTLCSAIRLSSNAHGHALLMRSPAWDDWLCIVRVVYVADRLALTAGRALEAMGTR